MNPEVVAVGDIDSAVDRRVSYKMGTVADLQGVLDGNLALGTADRQRSVDPCTSLPRLPALAMVLMGMGQLAVVGEEGCSPGFAGCMPSIAVLQAYGRSSGRLWKAWREDPGGYLK